MFARTMRKLLTTAGIAALDTAIEQKTAEERPRRERKPSRKGLPFRHYIGSDSALRRIVLRSGALAFRRTNTFLHATKGRRTFRQGVPAPLGFTARPPGKIDRLHAARAQGRAQ